MNNKKIRKGVNGREEHPSRSRVPLAPIIVYVHVPHMDDSGQLPWHGGGVWSWNELNLYPQVPPKETKCFTGVGTYHAKCLPRAGLNP